jgi:hypothetical protein
VTSPSFICSAGSLTFFFFVILIMRFIPQSSYSIQEIEQQCRDAINPPVRYQATLRQVGYSNVIQFSRYQQPVSA